MKIAESINSKLLLKEIYAIQTDIYIEIKDYENAFHYKNLFSNLKDTLFRDEKIKAIADMNAKFEISVKENENQLLKKNYEIQSYKYQKQKILNISIFLILLSFIFIAYILHKARKKTKQINTQLKKKNIEIHQQNEEISTQSEYLQQANDQISTQNVELQIRDKHITDSINYAKRIQTAVLPASNRLKQILPEYFILFKPLSIVSGDFYWSLKMRKHLVFAIADCTGHGVSGAFMSMLGISFLNEIVRRKEIIQPNQALEELRYQVKSTLKQTGKANETKDGMDIALCTIDTETLQLHYSGANNPLYIYRNNELIEFKPDKQPIGIHYKEKPFTNHEFQLEKEDVLYLFTDGYIDQFGGEDDRKFLSHRFKKLLKEIHKKPMTEQKAILTDSFENWQSKNSQTDDVLVMGVRIKLWSR